MGNKLTDIFLDFSLNDFSNVPKTFKEYCNHAVLMIKDLKTFYLFSAEEYDKFIEKAKKVKHSTEILRFFNHESVVIESFESLPETLENYAEHFWNQRYTSFHLVCKDNIYLILKE